ncbi:MAG: 50S ribosomal protein L4 [Leptospiraceae bacterium]|nr:50S ribosomal protein L4 [Leptospiraceae bacterium]
MKAQKFDATGKKSGDLNLPDSVFGVEVNAGLIREIIDLENRNRRQGTHKTKTVSEVSGGGKKPWRQKGTGNARQGSTRSVQWKGGGISHGPVPRDYSVRVPDKKRKAGIRAVFSYKASKDAIFVLADLDVQEFSTKKVHGVFKAMGLIPGSTVVFVTMGADEKLRKSVSNIPVVHHMDATRITAPELYYNSRLVISESALAHLEKTYAAQGVK